MASNAGNQTRSTSIPGIERATGRLWSEWVDYFEAAGARSLAHPEIARLARAAVSDDLKSVDWWAQGIAIAYEQHAGLRVRVRGLHAQNRAAQSARAGQRVALNIAGDICIYTNRNVVVEEL